MPITIQGALSFCGRELTAEDISLIRQIIAGYPKVSQTGLSSTIYELLGWRRPNGGLKSRECFLFLQLLQQRGWLELLPKLRTCKKKGHSPARIEAASDPQPLARLNPNRNEPKVANHGHSAKGSEFFDVAPKTLTE